MEYVKDAIVHEFIIPTHATERVIKYVNEIPREWLGGLPDRFFELGSVGGSSYMTGICAECKKECKPITDDQDNTLSDCCGDGVHDAWVFERRVNIYSTGIL